jgi:hypothetical protein
MLVCSLIAAGLLAACGVTSRYEETGLRLSRTEHLAALYGIAKAWRPLGRGYAYALSDQENARARFFLDSCVSELTARFRPAPGPALRAVQIGECMQARGWHLVVEELVARPRSRAAMSSGYR